MRTTRDALLGLVALVCGTLLMSGPAHAVTIDATFSSGCSNCGGLNESDMATLNSVQQAAIEAADNQIASQFGGSSLSTDIVYIGYHGGTNSFLGASVSGSTVYTYSQYVTALTLDSALHPNNTVLSSAIANLASGNGFGDPTAYVNVNTTTARNLGLTLGAPNSFGPSDQTPEFDANGNFVGPDNGGVADGVIFLNLDQPLAFTRPITSSQVTYDAESTMEHETDEVLGIGGAGSVLNAANADPNYSLDDFGVAGTVYGTMDLYRYMAPGVPSFDSTDAFSTNCPAPFCDHQSPYFWSMAG